MNRIRKLQTAHPLRVYSEILVFGGGLSVLTGLIYGSMALALYSLALLFFINPLCAVYYALRLRVPQGRFLRQSALEILGLIGIMGLACGVMGLVLHEPAQRNGTPPSLEIVTILLFVALIFPYVFFRVLVRLGDWWWVRQQRHLIWSLMNSHLIALALLQTAVSVPLLLVIMSNVNVQWADSVMPQNSVGQFFYRVNVTLPVLGLVILAATSILIALLPASALVSYFLARRIKQRLDALMQAAHAARDGDYQTRVQISGSDEISQLQTDFNTMIASLATNVSALEAEREKVTTLLKLRHELVANVSHELRTPLATIRAYLEAIQRRETQQWQAEELLLLQRETHLLQTLIEDLFALSRAETDHLSLHITPLELPMLIERIISTVAPLAWQNQRIQIIAQIPAWLPPIAADAQRLEQAFRNLIHNSLRHTLPGGVILVTASYDQHTAMLQIRDSGAGIAPADLPHIWERYYHSAEHGETGLGLALVKSFIEAMQGSVAVASTLGEGTTFTLTLPIVQPAFQTTLPKPQPVHK